MATVVKHVLFVDRSVSFNDEKAPGELSRRHSRSSRTASDSGSEGGERSTAPFLAMLDPSGESAESELIQPMASSLQALVDDNDELRRASGLVSQRPFPLLLLKKFQLRCWGQGSSFTCQQDRGCPDASSFSPVRPCRKQVAGRLLSMASGHLPSPWKLTSAVWRSTQSAAPYALSTRSRT
jgi:hypothetical protein